jgi:uncharacterized protein DUF3597
VSIISSIMSKIFGHHEAAAAAEAPASASGTASSAEPVSSGGATTTPAAGGGQSVDVEAVLTDLASKNSQQLNWRISIVDLLKLLNLDSSLSAAGTRAGTTLFR